LHSLGGDADYLEFADDMHGWVLAGELLSTSDGGVTWAAVTPRTAKVEHRPALLPVAPPNPPLYRPGPVARSLCLPEIGQPLPRFSWRSNG
jgi:hypothetical protein